MIVKTYKAINRLEALLRVREELGSNAVILSEKTVKSGGLLGMFAKTHVEIIAARGEAVPDKAVVSTNRKALLEEEIPEVLAKQRSEKQTDIKSSSVQRLEQEIAGLKKQLESLSLNAIVAPIEKQKEAEDDDATHPFSPKILKTLMIAGPILPTNKPPKVVALVGPTGVGKTTTIAKLSAEYALNQKKKVGLLTLDTYRIGAVDQLRTYSEIMDVPLQIASNADEAREALENFRQCDFVFIDTVGRSQKSASKLSELKKALEPTQAEVHLCLTATTKPTDLRDIVSRFRSLNPSRYLFTKMDETDDPSSLLATYEEYPLPISYLTTGQRVPEDIEVATKERLDNIVKIVA